jgi:hypothetical protein
MPHHQDKKNANKEPVARQDVETIIKQYVVGFSQEIERLQIVSFEKERLKKISANLLPSVAKIWTQEEDRLSFQISQRLRDPQALDLFRRAELLLNEMFEDYHLNFLRYLEEQGTPVAIATRICLFIRSIPRVLIGILRSDGWDEIASSIAVADATTGYRIKAVLFGLLTIPLLLGTRHAVDEFKELLQAIKSHQNQPGEPSKLSKVGAGIQQGLELVGYVGMAMGTFTYMLNQLTALSETVVGFGREGGNTTTTGVNNVQNGFIFAEQPISIQLQLAALAAMMLGQVPMALRAVGGGLAGLCRSISTYYHTHGVNKESPLTQASLERNRRDARGGLLEVIFHHVPVGMGQALLFWANVDTMKKIIAEGDSDLTALESARAYIGLGLTLGGLLCGLLPKLLPKKGSSKGDGVAQKILPRPELQHQVNLAKKDRSTLLQRHDQISLLFNDIQTGLDSNKNLNREERVTLVALKQIIGVIKDEEIPAAFGWVVRQPIPELITQRTQV